MATICAAYVLTVVAATVLAIWMVSTGSGGSVNWPDSVRPWHVVVIAVVALAAITAAIARLASERLAARAVRVAGARVPTPVETASAQPCLDDFAVALGFAPPALRVVDDAAPNAFAVGRGRACVVCVTTGALLLPPDQLQALCAQTMTSVANRALPLTCASADLMVVARRCTQSIWFVCGLILVSSIFGVPALLAAAVTAAIAVLVVVTIPAIGIAQRAVPRLRSRAALLADLDAVALTNRPAPLARALMATASNRRTVLTAWPIALLWFDLDVAPTAPGRFASTMQTAMDGDIVQTAPQLAARARRELLDRARVLVDLASGDPTLRAELLRAEQS
jgi:Zn-dependent protease with chaperone function